MKRWVCGVLLGVQVLSGCRIALGQAESEAPLLPPVEAEVTAVQAEGRVEPSRWVTLRAATPTQVSEVYVAEGDRVVAGDAVVAFDATAARLVVQQAEAALAVAESQVALVRAGARPEALALMDAQVAAATAVVSQSTALLDVRFAGETQAEVAAAEADILAAQVVHSAANDAHDDTMKCYHVTQEDGSQREICPALGTFEEMARAQMEAAWARLEAAQAGLDAAKRVGLAETEAVRGDVGVAQANLALARAARAQAGAGSSVEQVRVADAAVGEAEAALVGVLAELEATTVAAPFDGVVSAVDVLPGETVGAGAPLATIATLDQLHIRTRDLSELDVVRTAVGQPVAVRVDAYPSAVLDGRVERIEPRSSDYLGDVIYAVIVELSEIPAWLRWGMTVDIRIGSEASDETMQVVAPAGVPAGAPAGAPVAEAILVPEAEIVLGPRIGGEVGSVDVAVGQQVAEGELLLSLETNGLLAAVQQAEAALASAEAKLALAMAEPLSEDVAAVQAEIDIARAELARAVARRNHLSAQSGEAQTTAVEAELAAARAHRRETEAYLHWAEGDEDDERISQWQLKLAAANQEIAAIEMRLDAAPRGRRAQLRAAAAGVSAAEARVAAAESMLALVEAGPAAEAVTVAATRVRQAQLIVDGVRLQLAYAKVRAPTAGTVTAMRAEVGEAVVPGQEIIELATLDRLEVRSGNLMEVDVVNVTPGQPVTIKLDALPDRTLSGTVIRVGLQEELYRGDVTYPVVISLDEQPETLRWGMSAVVEIGH